MCTARLLFELHQHTLQLSDPHGFHTVLLSTARLGRGNPHSRNPSTVLARVKMSGGLRRHEPERFPHSSRICHCQTRLSGRVVGAQNNEFAKKSDA